METLHLRCFHFTDNSHFGHLQRNNFHTIIWDKEGEGALKADLSEYLFDANTLFCVCTLSTFYVSLPTKK